MSLPVEREPQAGAPPPVEVATVAVVPVGASPAPLEPGAPTAAQPAPSPWLAVTTSEALGLAVEPPELERRRAQRRVVMAGTLVVLVGMASVLLAVVGPAAWRALGPEPPALARSGLFRHIRLLAWANGPWDEAEPALDSGGRAGRSQGGSLGGAEPPDHWSVRAQLGKLTEEALKERSGVELVPEPAGSAAGGVRYRLGVTREPTTIRAAPELEAEIRSDVPAGEALVVAAAFEGWLLVAFSTPKGAVVGWVEKARVVVQ